MGNFGKSELHQNNVLRFVKALLLLVQGDLQLEDSQLSAAVKVKWVQDAENRLEVTGEYKTKTRTGKEKREKGTTKQALWQLVEKTGTPLELGSIPFWKREKNYSRLIIANNFLT
jgi:hypothetical protein